MEPRHGARRCAAAHHQVSRIEVRSRRVRVAGRSRFRNVVEGLVTAAGIALLAWAWLADLKWHEEHVFWRYCLVEPIEVARMTTRRWIAGGLGAALILLVRPLLGWWIGGRTARDMAGWLRIAVAAIAALVACDFLLRMHVFHPRAGQHLLFVTPEEHYEWHNTPSSTTVIEYARGPIHYIIDASGSRAPAQDHVLDTSLPTLVFTGESIAFGFGVEYEESYPALVGKSLGIQEANVSVSAYSNDQVYMRTHDEMPRFAHPLALVTLAVPAQLRRNVEMSHPHFLVRPDDTVEELPALPKIISQSPLRDLFENLFPYHDAKAIEIARAAFAGTARDARRKGAYPLFVFTNWGLPCMAEPDGSIALEHRLFDGLELTHIRVDVDPSYWDVTSDHPDIRAHRVLADAITAALRPMLLSAAPH